MQVIEGNGIELQEGGCRICLDPKRIEGDLSFISHSHFDHLFTRDNGTPKACSPETKAMVEYRLGKEMNNTRQDHELEHISVRLKNSGHVLGSNSMVVESDEKLIYTGDVSLRKRAFLDGFKPEKCDTLILETTFGKPEYVFPSYREVEKQAKEWVNGCLSRGESVVLMGYSLGKAQLISYMFREYKQLLQKEILGINKIYADFGVKVPTKSLFDEKKLKEPFMLVSPPTRSAAWLKKLKEKHKVKTAVFSGWATGRGYKYMLGADEAFVLSDHADFLELKEIVQKCQPEKVYTYHGFAEEFAGYLEKQGFNAKAL